MGTNKTQDNALVMFDEVQFTYYNILPSEGIHFSDSI